jgi:ATP-dependent Lhr-like helicase
VALRRALPEAARDLGRLDPEAIARVREEAEPAPRDADELHDLLLSLVVAQPRLDCAVAFAELVGAGRAAELRAGTGPLWVAAEQRPLAEALFPGAAFVPDVRVPPSLAAKPRPDAEAAAVAAVRGQLDVSGPLGLAELGASTALPASLLEIALGRLEAEGFALRGRFTPAASAGGGEEYCARRLLARIHRYTQERLRREVAPVTAQELMRFLLRWQHVAQGTQREGVRGLLAVVHQLQGFELPAGAWEESVLPARVASYRPEWLDEICLSGDVVWGRLAPRSPAGGERAEAGRSAPTPSRATPLGFALREDLPWLLRAARGEALAAEPADGAAREILDLLRARGALFPPELAAQSRRTAREVEEALWELVSRGLVTADGYAALRALLGSRGRASGRGWPRRRHGRFALLPAADAALDREALAEAVAGQLLARWGVVFRELLARETLAVPWIDVLRAFRRLEARGTIRGGRFVTGFVGEQYALPGAVEALRQLRRSERSGETVLLSGADPLNLTGILVPGPRVPALRSQHVVYRDGLPVGGEAAIPLSPARPPPPSAPGELPPAPTAA